MHFRPDEQDFSNIRDMVIVAFQNQSESASSFLGYGVSYLGERKV